MRFSPICLKATETSLLRKPDRHRTGPALSLRSEVPEKNPSTRIRPRQDVPENARSACTLPTREGTCGRDLPYQTVLHVQIGVEGLVIIHDLPASDQQAVTLQTKTTDTSSPDSFPLRNDDRSARTRSVSINLTHKWQHSRPRGTWRAEAAARGAAPPPAQPPTAPSPGNGLRGIAHTAVTDCDKRGAEGVRQHCVGGRCVLQGQEGPGWGQHTQGQRSGQEAARGKASRQPRA